MRPVDCEACGRPQPKDWQPGQRCVHCGGAVRLETRCAACTQWTPAGKFCRHCAAELVPDEWYGAARMLVAAGVDALSLAARVTALHPEQREAFSSRFAVQRAIVEQLVQEARWAESFLVTKGHADRLEEQLVQALPWRAEFVDKQRPRGPFDDAAALERSRTGSPRHETRALAALALARTGDARRDVVRDVQAHLHEDDPLEAEAALALARLHLIEDVEALSRWNAEAFTGAVTRLQERGARGLELALAVAVSLQLQHREVAPLLEREGLVAVLREGLASPEAGTRFACAALLGDAAALDALVDDERFRERALRALSRLGSARLVTRLRAARDDDETNELLRRLRPPLDGDAFTAVVELVERTSGELRRDALRLLLRTDWAEVDAAGRARFGAWCAAATLEAEPALDVLRWAVATGDNARPYRDADEVAPFAALAARALARAPKERQTLSLHGVTELLAIATRRPALECVTAWAAAPETRAEVWRRLLDLQGSLSSHADPPDERGVRALLLVWEGLGAEGRAAAAEDLGEALRRGTGSSAKEPVHAALWERFLAREDERAPLWVAMRDLRRDFEERRDSDARAAALDEGDPARRFALYSGLDPVTAPEALRVTMERYGTAPQARGLTPIVVERAATLFARGEHRRAMWLVTSWFAEVVNRFREDETREDWRATALALPAAAQEVARHRAATPPSDPKDDLRGFDEHLETELRLAREVVEHEAEAAARAQQRLDREAEARRREEERQREEAERQAHAQRQLEAARAAMAQATAQVADVGAGNPLDTEVLVPEQPIQTLRDYAALMKALQGGADVMALFERAGLTPTTWGACASAWSTVMTKRLDVALRFTQLLSQ